MARSQKPARPRGSAVPLPQQPAAAAHGKSHAIRETVESIVIAFVLAFLFRTFEAEAFVIPTGSMAPTLMGEHKDVDCPKCGHRYQVNASDESSEETLRMMLELRRPGLDARRRLELDRRVRDAQCLAGVCPICRYTMPMRADLASLVPDSQGMHFENQPSYSGDRILVNKYIYTFRDPDRWDVVVFHFPGNAQVNYIKRLVGLPGEIIRVFQGDLFIADKKADAADDGTPADDFTIAHKPADKVLAMRQVVHDTDYDPVDLYDAGWPLRWQAVSDDVDNGWQVEAGIDDGHVRQRYSVDAGDQAEWLRYHHLVPDYHDWRRVGELKQAGEDGPLAEELRAMLRAAARPQLIMDFTAYNTRISELTLDANGELSVEPHKDGVHWVGDLTVEADVDILSTEGELLIDLVEAGQHFTCTVDLATGQATLAAGDDQRFAPIAETDIRGPGSYRVMLANVDDQLYFWVDGHLVEFDSSTRYDAARVFGSREAILPRTGEEDPGDLAPAGLGARGARLTVSRLQVWRDIYYIADSWERKMQARDNVVTDFEHPLDRQLLRIAEDPSLWGRFEERHQVDFPLGNDQFFVMGDNSAESSDARLWRAPGQPTGGRPSGDYLERRMLIGKALCVYWPHSWNRIPGTPIPFPFFPNFHDMRLVILYLPGRGRPAARDPTHTSWRTPRVSAQSSRPGEVVR